MSKKTREVKIQVGNLIAGSVVKYLDLYWIIEDNNGNGSSLVGESEGYSRNTWIENNVVVIITLDSSHAAIDPEED